MSFLGASNVNFRWLKVWRSYHVAKLLWRSYYVAKVLATHSALSTEVQCEEASKFIWHLGILHIDINIHILFIKIKLE